MSNPLEGHRGTSQFVDRREKSPDGEMVDVVRRRPDRHSKVVYDASVPHELIGPTEAEIRAREPFSDSPKRNARLVGRAISAARSRLGGSRSSGRS